MITLLNDEGMNNNWQPRKRPLHFLLALIENHVPAGNKFPVRNLISALDLQHWLISMCIEDIVGLHLFKISQTKLSIIL